MKKEIIKDVARELPVIKPEHVKVEARMYERSVIARLPEGIIPQNIHDHPKLFSLVQRDSNKALRRFDEIKLISNDETWVITDGFVVDADDKGAMIDFKRIVQLPSRSESYEDDLFRVYFDGADRYVVDRKTDRVRLARGFATVAQAKIEMQRMYPRKAS